MEAVWKIDVVDFPASIVEPADSSASLFAEDDLSATAAGAIFSSEMALVSTVSRQVELARTPLGAKKVAKSILLNEAIVFRGMPLWCGRWGSSANQSPHKSQILRKLFPCGWVKPQVR